MKKYVVIWLLVPGLIRPVSRAASPQYLFDEFGAVDDASKLPTPFTPLPQKEPVVGLFSS